MAQRLGMQKTIERSTIYFIFYDRAEVKRIFQRSNDTLYPPLEPTLHCDQPTIARKSEEERNARTINKFT